MSYIVGFVSAVPTANREAYNQHLEQVAPLLKEFGATRIVETWADDVQEGKVTDFRKAVLAKPGESIVFSWHEYPSKEAADKAYETMMQDERMHRLGAEMPFDGSRMIVGGFEPLFEA